jgi:microcystin-dependent protein
MANVPTLSTSADLSASQTAGAPALVMPTGVILPYGGTTAPTGWLACDGTAISRTTYASLFTSIGTSFGVGDGSTTFNLPDLRGRFPRFNDRMFPGDAAGAAGRDTGRVHGSAQTQATAKNGLTATATASSISGTGAASAISGTGAASAISGTSGAMSANASHSHNLASSGAVLASGTGAGAQLTLGGGSYVQTGISSANTDHTHSISGTAAGQTVTGTAAGQTVTGTAAAQIITVGNGDAETRPINLAISAIIKI